jgi:hypothetical protein
LTEADKANSVGSKGSGSTERDGDGSGFIAGSVFFGAFFAGSWVLAIRFTSLGGFLGFSCLGGTFFVMSVLFSTGGGGVGEGEGK